MNKILLIGEIGEIVRSLNDCLEREFRVQICSEQIEMIQGMAKIVRPELIIVCQIGIEELDNAIFSWVKEKQPGTPVLVITTKEGWGQIRDCCQGEQFARLFRPVTNQELVEKCYSMLGGMPADPEIVVPKEGIKELRGEPDKEQTKKERRYTIMVVDDSPLVLRNVKAMLEEKYQVFVAPSGEKALELIPKKHPDLLLLDYEMPGMDGKEVYEIMQNDVYMSAIPVIFLTGIAEKDQVYKVLKARPEGYILKPADSERLLDEITKVLP